METEQTDPPPAAAPAPAAAAERPNQHQHQRSPLASHSFACPAGVEDLLGSDLGSGDLLGTSAADASGAQGVPPFSLDVVAGGAAAGGVGCCPCCSGSAPPLPPYDGDGETIAAAAAAVVTEVVPPPPNPAADRRACTGACASDADADAAAAPADTATTAADAPPTPPPSPPSQQRYPSEPTLVSRSHPRPPSPLADRSITAPSRPLGSLGSREAGSSRGDGASPTWMRPGPASASASAEPGHARRRASSNGRSATRPATLGADLQP